MLVNKLLLQLSNNWWFPEKIKKNITCCPGVCDCAAGRSMDDRSVTAGAKLAY
ncbi:hypothetical protein PIECOFPK_02834 [Mycovorax composti]|uniref:Uncharacterized protein n=1 Tax=Mycovorax composti TaxID=2962693 RepID=A0ABZ2EPG9_9BACT